MKPALHGCVDEVGCCGLREVHSLFVGVREWGLSVKDSMEPGLAYFATTIAREQATIKALKRLGFKPKLKWKNKNTTNLVTLWTFVPGQKKRKRSKK